jgi:hypothetical protein
VLVVLDEHAGEILGGNLPLKAKVTATDLGTRELGEQYETAGL